MDRRQQTILGVVGALVLVALITLVVRSGGDDDDDAVAAGATTTTAVGSTSTTSTTTTTSLVSTSTTASVTTSSLVGGTSPSTTTAAPIVTGQGAVLRPPSTPDVRATAPDAPCNSLADPGWEVVCAKHGAFDVTWVAMIETRSLPNSRTAWRAYVLREVGPGRWSVELRALDDSGTRFKNIIFRFSAVRPPGDEVTFGFRSADDDLLAVDVVEIPGVVVVHRDLARGAGRVVVGQLDTWRSLTPGGSTYAHEVIKYQDGAWRIVSSETVRGTDVPPSQL